MSAVANQGGDLALRTVCRGEAPLDGGRPVVHHDVVADHSELLAVRLHDLSHQTRPEHSGVECSAVQSFLCLVSTLEREPG